MGRQAKRRRERRNRAEQAASIAPPPPRPWWHNPWAAGFAGAGLLATIAVARLVTADNENARADPAAHTTPAPPPKARRDTEREPNDEPGQATELGSRPAPRPSRHTKPWATLLAGHGGRGTLSTVGDVDCYRLPLSVPATGAVVRVQIETDAAAELAIEVFDGDQRLAATTTASTGSATLPAVGARSWVDGYAICVSTADSTAEAIRYRVDARVLGPDAPFEFEPNDDDATASGLPRETSIAGYLSRGDVDWYRISSGPDAVLEARFGGVPGVAAEVALLDATGRELARARGDAGSAIRVVAPRPALVRVRSLDGSNVDLRYALEVGPVQ